MKWFSRLLMSVGVFFLMAFGYTTWDHANASSVTLDEARTVLETKQVEAAEQEEYDIANFTAEKNEAFGVLTVPKLDNRSVGVVEGADADSLRRGVGHVSSTAFPDKVSKLFSQDTAIRYSVTLDRSKLGIRLL